ncbi:MAG TPA: phosphatase PAP2 family protein [Opitutaceae bacterium]|jgi:membrane-associated phospholipid phosphatase|nr:phosphatase PAP2 family protein [Opitutaceae bacterium]
MMTIRLPLFANHRNKYVYGVVLAAASYLLYGITNYFQIFPARILPFTSFEKAMPLLPWTVWPYFTYFIIMIFIFFDVKNLENLHRLTYAFFALQIVSNLVFVLYPVAIPRELYPIPDNLDPATAWLLHLIRNVDSVRNCLPSLHVGNCCLAGLVYWKENRRKFIFSGPWILLVSFSTLGTKQHYLWDVIAGLALATTLFCLAFNRRILVFKMSGEKCVTGKSSEMVSSTADLPAGSDGNHQT